MAKMKRLVLKADWEKLPKEQQEYYTPSTSDPNEYILDTDDTDYKAKLDEFRTNNRNLHKEREDLQKQMKTYDGIDPAKAREAFEALKQLDKIEESELIKQGKLDDVVSKRTQAMRSDLERQVKAKDEALEKANKEAVALRNSLGVVLIDNTVTISVNKVAKVRPSAMDDIINRARQIWCVDEEGKTVAKRGTEKVFGKKGEPLTMDEWVADLLEKAPHLFEGGSGGGGSGGKKGDGSGKRVVASDPVSFGKNLEDIASGKVEVNTER